MNSRKEDRTVAGIMGFLVGISAMGLLALAFPPDCHATEQMHTEQECLASAIYFEARSESAIGQVAVAQVVMNRVASAHFPNTICEVVKQPHQFSFYWDGKPDTPYNAPVWDYSMQLAELFLKGARFGPVKDALYYHGVGSWPYWASQMHAVGIFGHHIFYEYNKT